MKKPIKRGDYFLMPFTGKARELLVRAVAPRTGLGAGQWQVAYLNGSNSICLLTSCHRCPPSRVARILKTLEG